MHDDGDTSTPHDPTERRNPSGQTVAPPQRFLDFWDRYREEIFRACLAWTNGRTSEAEDALGATALAALQAFDQVRRPRSWLLRVAYNACMDRHRARSKRAEQSLDDGDATLEGDPATVWKPRLPTPEGQLLSKEFEAFLSVCIDDLPDRLRQPICHKLEQHSYQRIAHDLGITNANARKRVQHARQILRRRIGDYTSHRRPAAVSGRSSRQVERSPLAQLPRILFLWQTSVRRTGEPAREVILCLRHRVDQPVPGIAGLERYVAAHPRGWKRRLRLARALRMRGLLERSIRHYENVVERNPVRLDAWLELASSQALLGHRPAMLQVLARAGERFEEPVARALLRAWSAAGRGARGDAARDFARGLAHSRGSDTVTLLLERGRMRYAARDWTGAARDFEHALKVDASDPVARLLAHDAHCHLGNRQAARHHLARMRQEVGAGLPAALRAIYHRSPSALQDGREAGRLLAEIRRLRSAAPDCLEPVFAELVLLRARGATGPAQHLLDTVADRFADHRGLTLLSALPPAPAAAIERFLFPPRLASFE